VVPRTPIAETGGSSGWKSRSLSWCTEAGAVAAVDLAICGPQSGHLLLLAGRTRTISCCPYVDVCGRRSPPPQPQSAIEWGRVARVPSLVLSRVHDSSSVEPPI
jgi:hypothetical protein